jgi:small subunit ribosomal protein S21
LVRIEKRPGENEAQMFRRFRKRVMRSQLLSTVRKKRWFVSKGEQRRIDQKKGIQRAQKRQRKNNRRY